MFPSALVLFGRLGCNPNFRHRLHLASFDDVVVNLELNGILLRRMSLKQIYLVSIWLAYQKLISIVSCKGKMYTAVILPKVDKYNDLSQAFGGGEGMETVSKLVTSQSLCKNWIKHIHTNNLVKCKVIDSSSLKTNSVQ